MIGVYITFNDWLERELSNRATSFEPAARSRLQAGFAILTACFSLHSPHHDYFCRRLDSTREICEQWVAEKAGIKNPKLHYATVGQNLLLSFIQEDDGSKLIIFARGPFGKSIWSAKEDVLGTGPIPALINLIHPEKLPIPGPLTLRPPAIHDPEADVLETIDQSDVAATDSALRDSAAVDYVKWFDWLKLGLYTPFADTAPHKRPRAIDFLTMLGILGDSNRRDVRVHGAATVGPIIAAFDALDITPVTLIPITHILPTDNSLAFFPEHFGRGTALLEQFLRDIGESFEISEPVAVAHHLPKVRSAVPLIPSVSSFGVLVVPSMAATEEDARAVAESAKTALIHIIFNETDFEYLPPGTSEDRFVLVVRPSVCGRYHVSEVGALTGVISPFANEQTLTGHSLAFRIGLILELADYLGTDEVQNTVEKRIALLGRLCTAPAKATLVGSVHTEFEDAMGA
jgi:hypothetical protein